MLVLVDVVSVAEYAPHSCFGGQARFGDPVDESLGLQTVRDHLRNRDERQTVLRGKALQLRPTGTRTVLAEDLAYDTSGNEPCQTREVNCGLRVPDALQHTAITRS